MRPLVRRSLRARRSEEALSYRIEKKKFALLVGDDHGIAHVGQNGLQDFVGATEFLLRSFSLNHQVQLCSDRSNDLDQLFALASRFAHEKLDHRNDLIA